MRVSAILLTLAILCAGCSVGTPTATDVKLHGLFTDNMVLQRGGPIAVYGTARSPAGEAGVVVVRLDQDAAAAKVDASGRWRAQLPARLAGGPYTLEVAGKDRTLTLRNVMVGEVWICSGQSNMEMYLRDVKDGADVVAAANYPDLRLFTVPKGVSETPLDDVHGRWSPCTPQSAPTFSATGYYFGRELYRQLGVPVGLINSSWGGTCAEAWTTPATLNADPILSPVLRRYNDQERDFPAIWARYQQALAKWWQEHPEARDSFQHDAGNQGLGWGWAKSDFADAAWQTMDLPQMWEGIIKCNGSVWFRRQVTIPPEWAGKELELALGVVDDFDTTYFDGRQVGATGGEGQQTYMIPRHYKVPGAMVKAGQATIAVRVFDHFGGGGFSGGPMSLGPAGSKDALALAGPWKYKIEKAMDPAKLKPYPAGMPFPEFVPKNQTMPGGLFNAMIHPLLGYGLAGAIWYQGESNSPRAEQYRTLLPAMIGDWRRGAGHDFTFLIVQLPTYGGGTDWAELREAQALTARRLPKVGLAVTLDIPDGDLHPKLKQPVGDRLARQALAIAYGWRLVASGPTYRSMKIEGKTVRLTFRNVGGGLAIGPMAANPGASLAAAPSGFVIAGADRKFVPAQARIENNTIVVWSDSVPQPAGVRYAFDNGTGNCNLVNADGLPCGTFRTDDWPVQTTGQR